MGQVRNFLVEFGCFCLGSRYVRTTNPLVKSLLLYGPRQSGKTMLARAIANSVGARFFDLSPANLLGEPNRFDSAKEFSRAVFLAFDMAKKLEPSVILIEDIDRVFAGGKKKKGDGKKEATASMMKKELLAMKTSLKAKERVLIIGTAGEGLFADDVDSEALKNFFIDSTEGNEMSMTCFTPYPDFQSRWKLWEHFILEKDVDVGKCVVDSLKSRDFDLSTLSRCSDGFTAGGIKQAVELCITNRRLEKYNTFGKKFTTAEFLNALSKTRSYTFADTFKKFSKWTSEACGRNAWIAMIKKRKKEAEAANAEEEGKD